MKNYKLTTLSIYFFFLLLGGSILLGACNKNRMFIEGSEALLEFSLDTVHFDTVFTELGSATQILKVYNPHDMAINIDRIFIESGASSSFRINVDGIPGNVAEDQIIEANDSLYIFAEVTVDPDQPVSLSPFVLEDGLRFETSGNEQRVQLEAWGQNAIYLPSRFSKGGVALLSCDLQEQVWTDSLPYVIYGVLVIDSCTLVMEPGTRVYVHGGVARTVDEMGEPLIYNDGLIFCQPNGNIHMEGTLEDPVVIQADRLEAGFQEEPGQWVGIRMGGRDNKFEHAVIKNSLIGALVDSAGVLEMEHTQIYNTSGGGLIGIHSEISATNCLFYNNGGNSVQLGYGGTYDFTYCSIASFGVDAAALSLSNGICFDPFCQEFDINPLDAKFRNTIIYGSRKDEISLSDFTQGIEPLFFDVKLEDCLVRVDDLIDPEEGGYTTFFEDFCNPCLNAGQNEVVFANPSENDYRLDTLSLAEELAVPLSGITIDLIGNERDPVAPDLGCYEYQYE